ncbi:MULTISPECIES: glycosyl hydrolase family 18 protein [Paenibacillus]|uniref:glycosyl hydrolase family 18 protein n=1 Tax=Paenibacillus TaxID=44249 RepID=UPI0022B8BB69|nr:glycosyl hydrolase family 18 protein [Paenibacillus caseinilyticus]MCZ8519620.1 glycosyl hydrolase family 18 protein [Paenibacillus caseinilyticus]
MNNPFGRQWANRARVAALSLSLLSSSFSYLGAADAAAPRSKPSAAQAAADGYKVVGYFTSWGIYGRNFQVTDIDASKLTHINYAFADVCFGGRHGNPAPDSPNKNTWSCTDPAVPLQRGSVPDGTIVLGEPWADVNQTVPGKTYTECQEGGCGNFERFRQLKAQNPHLRTLISVGGWTWSNRFSDVAASPALRQTFAKSAVTFLRTYGFDGVDIDWEYPVEGGIAGNSYRPADKQNYTLLLQDIRAELDAAGQQDGKYYELTIASGASQKYADNTELDKIAQIVDFINIMTYDFHGAWESETGFNAPLYSDPRDPYDAKKFYVDGAVQIYRSKGVPGSKLVLGLGFYGRGWKGCDPGTAGDGLYQTCKGGWDGNKVPTGTWDDWASGNSGIFDYGDLAANYVNKNGYTRYWNDYAKVPYVYNPTTGIFIGYDDVESIGLKTGYIKQQGLAGAMFWELSNDCRTSSKYACSGPKLLDKVASDLQGGTVPADTTPPTAPGNLTAAKTANTVTLSWNGSTDNYGVTGYEVYNGSTLVTTTSSKTYTVTGLTPKTAYTFKVVAKDAAGNKSPASQVQITTDELVPDAAAPSVPAGLAAAAKTDTSVNLTWTASTDNVGVTGYDIFKDGVLAGSSATNAYAVTGLAANTAYSFTVKAKDASGNLSAASAPLSVTTNVGGVVKATGKPAVPSVTHDNWDNDGSYTISFDVWWGNNGSSWKLYENNTLVHTENLVDNSPGAQKGTKAFTGKAKGTYAYKVELINSFGTSTSQIVNVTVN